MKKKSKSLTGLTTEQEKTQTNAKEEKSYKNDKTSYL